MSAGKASTGMSEAQARTAEGLIIALCLLALFAIFQPFSLTLFSIGCGLVVFGGLVFNLVPFCQPGRPASDLWKVAGIILDRVRGGACSGPGLGVALRLLSPEPTQLRRPYASVSGTFSVSSSLATHQ